MKMSNMIGVLKELYKTYWYERLRGNRTGLAYLVYGPNSGTINLDSMLLDSLRDQIDEDQGDQLVDAFPEATKWNSETTTAVQSAIEEQA